MDKINYYTYQPPHGWNNGIVNSSGICPTIDATIMFWHTLIIEEHIKDERTYQVGKYIS